MAKKDGLNGWLQRVRRTGDYSDVVVRVNGEEFRLHMLPLRNASGYFRNLPSSSSGGAQAHEPSSRGNIVTVHDIPGGVEGFAIAADMCYLLKPSFTLYNVALVHAAAEFLDMDEITETTKRFMHAHIFAHWRQCTGFLQHYHRTDAPVDEYVELRCYKVVITACVKAFTEIKHVSAPSAYISGPLTPAAPLKPPSSSACQSLTELLVAVCSLPDRHAAEIINTLVDSDVNLSLKCRQGRSVRSWLESVMEDECGNDRSRCWVILCLSRMLLKSAPAKRPWMELSSQYWCSLLEHADMLLPLLDDPPLSTDRSSEGANLEEDQSQSYIKERLMGVKAILEEKIGESLEEMDEYLRDYKFSPETLMSLIDYYSSMGDDVHTEQSLEETAGDVDRFLYFYAGEGSITPEIFLNLFRAFPASSRSSHDTVYGAVEKLLISMPDCSHEEQQQLWSLIDHCKLGPAVNERALNNPAFLSQPEILESVLQHHSQELAKVDDGDDGRHMRHVMQKVINASLRLLEENSRRSREILELQKQYEELLGCRSQMLDHDGIVDLLRRHSVDSGHGTHGAASIVLTSETEESEASDSTATSSLGGASRLPVLPWRSSGVREEA